MAPSDIQPAYQPSTPPIVPIQNLDQPISSAAGALSHSASSLASLPTITNNHLSWSGLLLGANSTLPGSLDKSWVDDDKLRRLYYENFHAAHPILVPGSLYTRQNYPLFLQLVVHFVGSHYSTSNRTSTARFKESVFEDLSVSSDRSPCMVQAWLIYAIVLNAREELNEAQEALARGIDIALELGMNRSNFTHSSCSESSIEAESLRRTWWELFITDIHLGIPLTTTDFRCSSVALETALPSEESVYMAGGDVPQPRLMLDFKQRIFASEDSAFSSFSYRIEATMILSRVIMLNRILDCHRDHLQAVENALVSWVNHLPTQKLNIVDAYGNVDEMMFQAHLTINYAAMLLHLPRSDLQPKLAEVSNTQPWPAAPRQLSCTFTLPVHSIKAIEASRRLSDSISICPNILKHTPFIIPALSLCGMIQFAISTIHSEECFDHHLNRVTLVLGCLKSAKGTWKLADTAYRCIKLTASEAMLGSIRKTSLSHWSLPRYPGPDSPPLTDRSRSGSGRAGSQRDQQVIGLLAENFALTPDLTSAFIDPTCYNPSFFSPFQA